ncbi:Hypothetical protein SCLAV_4378 [Streptomyces clavuligerus]|uniref:Uncharacterized protein n=1 Tax=Streptomyces clavuligerus TaxID=1901 RepID=E2Q7R7_STRCL|nr:Hypothetical protein SCLAV_4378 [Streptomyces clavuligerus]
MILGARPRKPQRWHQDARPLGAIRTPFLRVEGASRMVVTGTAGHTSPTPGQGRKAGPVRRAPQPSVLSTRSCPRGIPCLAPLA